MALTGFNEETYLNYLLADLQSSAPQKIVISVISDPHYYAPSLGTEGAAFEAYLAADRKMIAESDAILQSAIDIVKNEKPNILLISGDLTKDGEKVSHEAFAAYLADIESTGVQVYVIPGNHDINNPDAMSYAGNTATPVESVSAEDFQEIYADFGYGEAIYRDSASLSYVATVSEKLWILALDSCEYDQNDTDPETSGSLSAETKAWALEKLAEAKLQGITVIGMMHHSLSEHFTLQADLFPDYVIEDDTTDGTSLAQELADAGLSLMFTGHFHANDINQTTDSALYEIETGSLVTWPSPVRTVTLNTDHTVDITTTSVTEVDYDLGGATSFEAYATDYLTSGLDQLAVSYLMGTFYITLDAANQVAPLFSAAMAAHYKGDETMDPTTLLTIQAMASSGNQMQVMLAGALQSLWTDGLPADNDVTIALNNFWSDKTPDDLRQILSDEYDLTPEQHYLSASSKLVLLGSIALPGAEIAAYHEETNMAFVIGGDDEMYVVDLSNPTNPVLRHTVTLAGNAQSVAVNANGLIAVAVDQEATVPGSSATYHGNGLVQFFTMSGTSIVSAGQVTVGSLPDSITFNENGTVLVTANEGEPNTFYTTDEDSMDPVGSISIIEVNGAAPALSAVTTLTFDAYNGQLEQLRNKGVRISGDDDADGITGNLVAQDMEPEYVSISGSKAYVTLQENNAVAVVDLTTKKISAIYPVGIKDWDRGTPEATSYEVTIDYPGNRPDFDNDGTVDNGEVVAGGLSGLWYEGKESVDGVEYDIYYSITDRGPQAFAIGDRATDNPNDLAKGEKVFEDPDFPITVYKLGMANGTVIELGSTTLKVPDGSGGFRDSTGLGMLDRNDKAYVSDGVENGSNTYSLIGKDQFGLDSECVLRLQIDGLNNGNPVFAVADEYGPQIAIFDAVSGNLIKRIMPAETDFAAATDIDYADIPAYTSETLPEIYSTIFNNRGFEAMAYNSSDGLLYTFVQSPLHPDGFSNQEVTRIIAVDPLTGEAKHEYLYSLTGEKGQDKIGDAVYDAERDVFYVIERDSGTTSNANKTIFEISLKGATDTLDYTLGNNGRSWEQLLGDGVTQPELSTEKSIADALDTISFVNKNELLNLPSLGIDPRFDKAEGLALKPDGTLVVGFDNDFIHVDGRPDNVLVEISFDELAVDTSDKDGGIDPGHRPFYGLRMPDGIDTYQYNGETFLVMANEGDGRIRPDAVNFVVEEEYDGAYLKLTATLPTDSALVDTLTDPLTKEDLYIIVSDSSDLDAHEVAEEDEFFLTMKYGWKSDDFFYSDETRLVDYDDLDKLNDYIQDEGGKKGEIGRLKTVNTEVYLSDDAAEGSPEQVIGFGGRSISIMDSKGNIVYDSGDLIEQAAIHAGVYDDERSDDKGTEPENVTLAEVGGQIYAYVALERANSIAVFDVTDPYHVSFVELVDVEGDTGFVSPEGLVTGDGLLIVSHEVEKGLAVYALADVPMVAEALVDVTITENEKFRHVVLSDTFADVDAGDSLTYTATLADGSALPSWLKFDASSHSLETMEAYFLSGGSAAKATDSASAITAIVTGHKTDAGNLSWAAGDPADGALTTIAETLRADYGFAIGVASTVEFSHATPAGVVSHNVNRGNTWAISHEILTETKPEVVIGAGLDSYFAKAGVAKTQTDTDSDADNNGFNDEYDAFHNGTLRTYTENVEFVERKAGVDGGDTLAAAAANVDLSAGERLFGLFGTSGGNFEYYNVADTPGTVSITRSMGDGTPAIDEDPTMAEMASAALTVLNQDSDGFFIMFEQGDIDWSNHANDYEAMIGGVYDLDLAVTEVEKFVASGVKGIDWSNTLVIVTSDHSNSYMRNESVLGQGDLGEVGADVTYSSTGHTNELVTVTARGAGATYFGELAGQIYDGTSIIDNTQIYTAMMNAAENTGAEHIILMIGDGMNIEHEIAASRYLYGEDFGLSWNDWGTLEDGWTGYATTWDVSSYNTYAALNGVVGYDTATYDPLIGYDPAQGGDTPYPVAMTFSGTPTHSNVGSIDLKVTATDESGAMASDVFTLTVTNTNDAPTVEHEIEDITTAENEKFRHVVLSDTFADVDAGDSLTYTATLADGSALPSWLKFDASSHSLETMEAYFLSGGSAAKATDSASAITAIVTGHKTDAGNLSWAAGDPADGALTTIAETLRADYGFAIGVASTVEFSHATPAGVVSHNVNRGNTWAISHEILTETKPEVVIGAGLDSYFAKAGVAKTQTDTDSDADNNGFNDEYDAFHNGTLRTYTENVEFVERKAGVDGGDTLAAAAANVDLSAGERLFGLFGTSGGNFEYYNVADTPGTVSITRSMGDGTPAIDEDPTMAEMASAALTVLNQDSDGFFIMFEQGDIDWSNHANDYEAMIGGVYDLDLAVTEVEKFVASGVKGIDWSNTLVIVTSDHSNSYMRNESVLGQGDLGEVGADVTYSSTGHTNELVTVTARGAGATYFGELAGQIYDGTSIIDNTQIYTAMMNAAENTGAEHIILMIGDGMNIEHEIAASRYLYGEDFGLSWNDWGTLEDGWTGYATTWDVSSYNTYAALNGVVGYDTATYDPLIGYDPAQGGDTPYPVAMTFSGTPTHSNVGSIDLKVTATDESGAMASDVFTLTVTDTTAPAVVTFSPADAATGVSVSSNIELIFSEVIQKGAGTIAIHSGSPDGAIVESYNAATSANLTISGTLLTINPTADLHYQTQYYVTFGEGSIYDNAGNHYAGNIAYDFATGADPFAENNGGSSTGTVLAGVGALGILALLIF
jgi:alkaline phosphatase